MKSDEIRKSSQTDAPRAKKAHVRPKRPLAKIRHDLRTPLNHIIGFSEILIEDAAGKVPEDFLRDLHRIRAGGDRLLGLIHQHLNSESFPATKPDLHQLCHELRTPVNHVIGYTELLSEQCGELGLTEYQSDLSKISAAAKSWLALMEEQLIGETGRPGVRARRAETTETEMFRRMERDRPAVTARPLRGNQRARVLLADDDEPNRELLCRRLEKLGYEVTAVANGLEALECARTSDFDLILLDLLMPGMNGQEVLSRLKADPALSHLPVIMISALDQVEGIARCIELGAEDYVAKPFNPVFLGARIGAGVEKKRSRDREVSYLRQIQEEKQRSDELLHIILPRDVAEELKSTSRVQPRRFENVGVLFCDVVGFTQYSDQHPPEEIVPQLQAVVEAFEEITSRHGLEKIKTIGDSFMGTVGLRTPTPNPAWTCVQCALEMIATARKLPPYWRVRAGVHLGPVVAGVVGHRKYQYDIWGDTVNLAARMQEVAEPGSVCVTAETARALEGHCHPTPMGRIEVKGKGPLDLFRIDG